MIKINGNIFNYLNSLQLCNNFQPIINEKYKEVGIIIKFGNNINQTINNNYDNNNNSNEIKDINSISNSKPNELLLFQWTKR